MKAWNRMVALTLSVGNILLSRSAWASEAAHGDEGIPLKPLIFASINLVLLLLILGYFLRKPAKEFFASRAALIKNSLDESRRMREEAGKKHAEYEQRLKNIEAETQRLIIQLKRDGELERERIIQEAHQQVEGLRSTSERVMKQELKRAREELKREAVALASALAEQLVRENITPEDQQRIVEKYLNQMEALS